MDEWITANEAAELLGVAVNSMHHIRHRHDIESKLVYGTDKNGKRAKRRIFNRHDIQVMVDSGYTPEDAKRRGGVTAARAASDGHPWRADQRDPDAREPLTPHTAVLAIIRAKQAIRNGRKVREVPSANYEDFAHLK